MFYLEFIPISIVDDPTNIIPMISSFSSINFMNGIVKTKTKTKKKKKKKSIHNRKSLTSNQYSN